MAVADLLADTSALARLHLPAVRAVLAPLLLDGRVATCSVIDLEVLYSARTAVEHAELRLERRGFERLDVEQVDWDRAADVQAELAARGQLRAVGLPDLLVAAVAERHRVTVLHYDRDYDLVSAVTGQPTRWVVPAGTAP